MCVEVCMCKSVCVCVCVCVCVMLQDLLVDTAELSARLEALGGGDARLAPLETVIRIIDGKTRLGEGDGDGDGDGDGHMIQVDGDDDGDGGGGVLVSVDARKGSRRRVFRASRAYHDGDGDYDIIKITQDAVQWVCDGFNATIIGYAQAGRLIDGDGDGDGA